MASGLTPLRLVIDMVRMTSPWLAPALVIASVLTALNRPREETSVQVMVPAAAAHVVVLGAGKKNSRVSPALETRNHQPSSKRMSPPVPTPVKFEVCEL